MTIKVDSCITLKSRNIAQIQDQQENLRYFHALLIVLDYMQITMKHESFIALVH